MRKHNIPQKVAEVLKEIGETSQTATWDCHGTIVILHKALEKVAAHKRIVFDAPVIVESSVEKKMVVVVVTGRLGDTVEWSFGEAAPYNNKNSYPFAMAEKRAKDRVILKLVGLHGDAYSEDEADDFKEANPDLVKNDNDNYTAKYGYIEHRSEVRTISDNQIITIEKLLDETKSDRFRFLSWFKVDDVKDILANDYERVVSALEAKKCLS